MASPRRARRRQLHRDDCDEIPTRIRKGETGTLTDKFGIYAETGAQVCDGFYTSSYQLAHCNVMPTSPAVEVPEFPVQRIDPCRTLGNFEVSSAYDSCKRSRSQSPSDFRMRSMSPLGSPHSLQPGKDGEAFANSLRKYPTPSDRLPTAQLLQKLIKLAQDKYTAKTSQLPKTRNASEKSSPGIHGSRSSKNLQSNTKSRNDSPKNEVLAAKKGRSGLTSPSPQCSREIVAEATFDYLNTDPETARGDRARSTVANNLRQMFGGTRPMVAYPICPKILSRYEQHRKQHHICDEENPQDGEASGSKGFFPWSTCEPVEPSTSCPHQRPCQPKPSMCLCRELRASEDDLQERLRLQEIVCAWLDGLPVSAKEKPQDKFMRDALIRKLIDTLSGMNDEEFEAKGKEEIAKCINEIPMWLPQQDSEKFKQDLVDNLFERIKGFRNRDRFKDVIAKWLEKIEFTEDVNKDEIVSMFSSALKQIALNRPTNDGIYRDKLKTKAYDLLEGLPIAVNIDREGLLTLKAEQLADELIRLPKDQVKPDSYFEEDFEDDEMTQLKALEAFAKGIQNREFAAIIIKALNEVDGLRELSTEIKEKETKDLISKLPNLLTDEEEFAAKETYDQVLKFLDKISGDNGVNLEDKIKVKFMDNLVDELEDTFAHHLEVGESISKFLVDLPKPPKQPPAQAGTTAAQPPDKALPTPKPAKGKVIIQDPRSVKEQSLPTDQRGVTLSQQETGQRRAEDRISPTPVDARKSPEKLPERQRPVGESYLEDHPTGIDEKSPRKSALSYQGDEGSRSSIIVVQARERVSTPKGPSEKRRPSSQSYLEDYESPIDQGVASGKRGRSPQKPTDERRASGESYLEDEGPTVRKPVGGTRGRQTDKRRVSAQSYLEDNSSPSSQGLAGKRSPSPREQTDERRISGQSLEDQDISNGRKAVSGIRSPQAAKRRVSAQSYMDDDDSPTGQGSPSPTGRKAVTGTRSPQNGRRISEQSYLQDYGSPTGRQAVSSSAMPTPKAGKRRTSGQSYLEDDGSPTGQGPSGGKRSISPRGQTDKRRASGQSYLEEDGIPTSQGLASPRGRTEKRRISRQGYLYEGSTTGLVSKGSATQQRADKHQVKKKCGDTRGPLYDSPSPRPHGRRPSIDIIGKGSPRCYGQSSPEDKASERMPMRPTIIDIESPNKIPSKRDVIQTGQIFGPGQLRRDRRAFEEAGSSYQVQVSGKFDTDKERTQAKYRSKDDKAYSKEMGYLSDESVMSNQPTGAKSYLKEPDEISKTKGKIESQKPVSKQVQVTEPQSKSYLSDTKERTQAKYRSKDDKAYSKEMGYLSDESVMSNQPTGAKSYLKERDEVSKTKGKIKRQKPVSKQVLTESQAKSFLSETKEPGKGMYQVYSEEQSKGLTIDNKQAKPSDTSKVAESQQNTESKIRESGSTKVQTSGDQKSKEMSVDKISSAQKTVGAKQQGEEKKRPSLNEESSIGLSPSQLKPHMKDEGRNTVKKMKSFLRRYRERVGLKKSGVFLTGVGESSESLTRNESVEGLSSERLGTKESLEGPSSERLDTKEYLEGPSSERLERRRVSFSSDENIFGSPHKKTMRSGVHDILDLTGPNLKNKSEVELKLADLLEDLVMRGMDEDSAWEQLLSILGPDVTLEEAQEIFSKLMETAHDISASMDPEGVSRIATGHGASTPKKVKQTAGKEAEELEFHDEFGDGIEDEFGDEFGGKFGGKSGGKFRGKFGDGEDDEFDNGWESGFDGKTDREREQEQLRNEAEREYNRIMFDKVKDWMGDNNILRTGAERDAVAQQLANDFVDRQKYLQLNPDAKTSPAEELEHMKYQVFKRLNKLLDPDEVNAIMVKVPELMERIKDVPVPQLTKGAKGAFVASPEELQNAISDWIKKEPLFKKQSEKKKEAMLNQMVPDLAKGLNAAVKPFLTGVSNENPDKVLMEEIVKIFKKTLPPKEARASLLEGMGKDLLKHLKELKLIPDSLTASVLGTSAMSGFNDVVSKWCNQLPIPNTEQGNKIKHDLANNIMAEIGELNMNPQILNDDILYDDILADFLELQLNAVPEEIDNKEGLITELLEEVKKLRQPLQQIMAGKLYNEKLRDAVEKALPPIDKRNEAEEASFEILKDNLADAFINLHYVGGDCALRNIFKNKINDEIDKFANEYLVRHPTEPLCRTQLKNNLYSALKKVDVPGEESMKSEVERVRMKDLIDEWAKELPMKCQSPAELLHTNKVLKAMTQRILDLEKENQLNPSDDYDQKLEKEIEKYVKRLPVLERSSLKEQQNLAKMLKDTEPSRTYTEGSRRSIEDLSISVCQPSQKETKSASLSGLCQHCRSSVMQSSKSYEPSCKDAALSPPPIDCCSQTEVVHKQDRFAQCKCSKTELPRVELCPSKTCPSKPCPSSNPCPNTKPCPNSNPCPKSNPCPSRKPCPAIAPSRVSIPCNTPRPRVSTGSQANITPYIIVDDDDTPTDQASECFSNPCLSSISIPKGVPCGTRTVEPCYSPPCRAQVTKLGSFNSDEYKSCTRRKVRNVDTQSRDFCYHSPRKVWSRPQCYRDTIPCAPLNNTGCRGQMQNCRGRRCHGHDPMMACPKCCGMKCPHPAKFFFR